MRGGSSLIESDFSQVGAIVSILFLDLVLSGDNAIVIGMAARDLPPKMRRRAILFGAGGAIGLRILFTAMAALLLGVPYLRLIGGVLLAWIAYKLLRPAHTVHGGKVDPAASTWAAIQTIVMADVVMSLDNVIAVAGASHGELWLLLLGLGVSIPLVAVGGGFVAWLLNRTPAFIYIGAGLLAWTAGAMVVEDIVVEPFVHALPGVNLLLPAILTAFIVVFGIFARRRGQVTWPSESGPR